MLAEIVSARRNTGYPGEDEERFVTSKESFYGESDRRDDDVAGWVRLRPQRDVSRLYPDMEALRESDELQEAIHTTGAVVMGRRSYDMGTRISRATSSRRRSSCSHTARLTRLAKVRTTD